MKSAFIRVSVPMADPEPPEPAPIPVRVVADLASQPHASTAVGADSNKKPNDDFYPAWKKFLAQEPKRAKVTSRAAAKIDAVKTAVEHSAGDGLATRENAATSWEQAAAECRAKVAAIVDECQRLNQKYRDALFDLEMDQYCLQNLSGRLPKAVDQIDIPPWIKRVEDIFEKPEFFIDGATANDVHQGNSGDCWFLAALMAVSARKELMERLCVARNEQVGVYGFVFFRDGEWIYEVIDDKLYIKVGDDDDLGIVRDWNVTAKEEMQISYDDEKLKNLLQKGGEALYFSHCKSNETWLPLIEKAYAKAHGDYFSIEGGSASEGIEDLTGGVGVVLNPEDIMDKERFWRDQLSQVNEKYLFGGGSKPTSTKGVVGSHAYAVLQAWEEGDLKLLKLRNPWGEKEWKGDWSDGSKLWTGEMMNKLQHTFGDDGVFWISYKDFLRHFARINRVRLFDSSWSVAQQWTSVNVPWTVDYLSTKFQITVTEKGPVVVVLCQPDDRYFLELAGRYTFSMHFRIYKEGEDSHWIVRSMHNSGNGTTYTRSVSAEIENIEPGTYDVVFKVTAVRQHTAPTAEEVILKYGLDRKTKLLSVGRRFDYAQSKGNLEGFESVNRKVQRQKKKDKEIGSWKKARKVNQEDRERARKRKKRINDAIQESHREYSKKCHERQRRHTAKRGEPSPTAPASESNATDIADETDKASETVVLTPSTDEGSHAGSPSVTESTTVLTSTNPPSTTESTSESTSADPSPKAPTTSSEASRSDAVAENLSALSIREKNSAPAAVTPSASPPKAEGKESSPGNEKRKDAASQNTGTVDRENDERDADAGSDSNSESEPPLDPPIADFADDDFDWDSDMDGVPSSAPSSWYNSSDLNAGGSLSGLGWRRESTAGGGGGGGGSAGGRGAGNGRGIGKTDLFADDPWKAVCVLGLRVYSKSAQTKVRVVKSEDEEGEDDVEDGDGGQS